MRGFRRFVRDETGAVTVEFTVLVPFFIFLLVIFADAAVLYLTHSEMYNLARDAARRMSTGQFENPNEVVTYSAEHLFLGQRTYTVYTSFGPTMSVLVEVPIDDATIFGYFFRPILGKSLIATAYWGREPRLLPAPGS